MSHGISPIIQVPEVGHTNRIRWIGICEIEQKAEALEVLANALDRRVPGVEFELGGELGLDRCPKADRHGGSAYLRAFRVEVPAKSLEMAAQQHGITLQALLSKWRWRRN